MSQQAVQQFAERATNDPAFRDKLTQDWAGALAEFDLTEDEQAILSRMRLDEMPDLAHGIGRGPLGEYERRQDNPPED